jgi:hypothetical protein
LISEVYLPAQELIVLRTRTDYKDEFEVEFEHEKRFDDMNGEHRTANRER